MIQYKRLWMVTIFIIYFSVDAFAESPIVKYYEYANKARYKYCLGKYEEAIALLDTAFSTTSTKPLYPDYYCMSLCYVKLYEKEKALEYLERCIKAQVRGGLLEVTFDVEDSIYIITSPEFSFIEKNPETKQKISLLLRPLYSLKYCNMEIVRLGDSVDYFHANEAYWQSVHNRTNIYRGYSLPKYIDTIHFKNHEAVLQEFLSFLKRNGYIGLRNGGIETMLTLLAHLSKEQKDDILPLLRKAWEAGNMTPCDYGFFLERRKIDDGLTSCGDYYIINTDCSVADWPRIRANRHSIGLSDYLDWGDYYLNTFDKSRNELPWIKKQLK